MSATLKPYAADPAFTLGRIHPEDSTIYRNAHQRDRDRIVHSSAFRRLEYKTQVFINHEGDLFRTRLTHSIEVAQIARSISRMLQLNEDLTEAIALAHDLGHTPFGHAGQDALNHCMKPFGGFEHNRQSLRVVDQLEERYAAFPGLNLTFETREGVLKHCNSKEAEKLGDLGQRFINKTQPSLEAQINNLADEIAYNNHDVDDGLRMGLLSIDQLRDIRLFNQQYEQVMQQYPDLKGRRVIYETIRGMINLLVIDLVETSKQLLEQHSPKSIDDVRKLQMPLIQFSEEVQRDTLEIKQFLRKELYKHPQVYRMTSKAKRVIEQLFNTFMEDPKLLPAEFNLLVQQQDDDVQRATVIADYIAGMTDRYCLTEYDRVFNPHTTC